MRGPYLKVHIRFSRAFNWTVRGGTPISMSMNKLSDEKSPYLLQHKDNPIHWMAWGEDAFRRAREEGKPVFLSVGYSTCHWCHVMAHESFEDQEVAKALNDDFISIKVDREERPDVDQIYMTALQSISGGGGWPMSVWLTSEGKPFFAGTYFPKQRFLQVLSKIQEIWKTEPAKLKLDAERLLEAVKQMESPVAGSVPEAEQEEFLSAYTTYFQHHFDEINGGFGGAPKFPQTMNLMVMLRRDFKTGLRQAETIVNSTLTHMVRGGIYDQLHGGFHRYSVDEKWMVPHFEKMLYDQSLITVTLLEAYQLYGGEEMARAARETLDYVSAEMTHAEGGFFSAQDADSLNSQTGEKEEGWFCTYDFRELAEMLTPAELELAQKHFGVTPAGNFEGRNILYLPDGVNGAEKPAELVAKLKSLRATRPQPHLDDKVIASWNGWMVWAMAKGAAVLSEPRYAQAATRALDFVQREMWQGGKLYRYWRDGVAKGRGTAEDYASVIHACLELYQVSFDPRWPDFALKLQKELDSAFWDPADELYFANDGHDPHLPLRPKEQYDGVHPSSNSMAAYNLARLYLLTGDEMFNTRYTQIMESLFPKLREYPSSLPFLAFAADFHVSDPKVGVLSGKGWTEELNALAGYQPHWLWAREGWPVSAGKSNPQTQAKLYVCRADRCLDPIHSFEDAKKFIAESR